MWAIEAMDIGPDDRVLEIGCGHGVAVSLLCERRARVTAIDRSAKMIDAATARNRKHIASGRAEVIRASLRDADLGDRQFDKVFAIHVHAMWDEPENLDVVRRHLAPGGALYLVHQHPGWGDPRDTKPLERLVTSVLRERGFSVGEPLVGEPGGTPTVAIVAR